MTSSGLRVHVLGPLEVWDTAGRAVAIPGARLATLLVRLALEDGRPVPAGTLIDDLWGAQAPAGELNALQSLISRLRRVLGGAAAVPQAAGGYRLALAPDGLDLAAFRRLAAEGRTRLRAGDASAAQRLLAEALELWRGPASAEVEQVSPGFAAVLEEQRVEATLDRIDAEDRLGSGADRLEELALLRARHPQHERMAALEIRALVSAGRVADALLAFDRVRRELAEGLGIDPSPVLQEAYALALAADAPAAPTTARPVANLPTAVTSFLGRDAELGRVTQLLTSGRLVTILGPGGAGKTRLALESGRRMHRESDSDVWLVELAGVTDGADVPQAVLAALGLREAAMLDGRTTPRPARETLDLLVDRFAGRPTLLLLDNCEHVIGAAAALADAALAACPACGSSRRAGSRWPSTASSCCRWRHWPFPSREHPSSRSRSCPRCELFVDRATAVRPDFRLDAESRSAVEEIVRRLDGLPLAIELAAARLRTLPVTELAARLSDRFRLLTSGSRTADARHRTLRAVVAWSWDLLEPDERLLAERVSVFPAGRHPGERVRGLRGPRPGRRGRAARLRDPGPPRRPRREVAAAAHPRPASGTGCWRRSASTAQERLVERGELDDVRLAAARHFAALVTEADTHLRGPRAAGVAGPAARGARQRASPRCAPAATWATRTRHCSSRSTSAGTGCSSAARRGGAAGPSRARAPRGHRPDPRPGRRASIGSLVRISAARLAAPGRGIGRSSASWFGSWPRTSRTTRVRCIALFVPIVLFVARRDDRARRRHGRGRSPTRTRG